MKESNVLGLYLTLLHCLNVVMLSDQIHLSPTPASSDANATSDLFQVLPSPPQSLAALPSMQDRAEIVQFLHWADLLLRSNCLGRPPISSQSIEVNIHCWIYLLDEMQRWGQLSEGEEDSCSFSQMMAVLTYLWGVVIVADKQFLPDRDHYNGSHNNNEGHNAMTRELLCIKDAMQRTDLQSCIPKHFWTHKALTIVDNLLGAHWMQVLEVGNQEGGMAIKVVNRFLASKWLYFKCNK